MGMYEEQCWLYRFAESVVSDADPAAPQFWRRGAWYDFHGIPPESNLYFDRCDVQCATLDALEAVVYRLAVELGKAKCAQSRRALRSK